MLPLNTNKAKAYFAGGASALHNRGASITDACLGAFLTLAEQWIYFPTEHRNILYRGIVNYISRGATTYFALGALNLAPHTNETLSSVTPEPTRELAKPRDTLIEDSESRLHNMEANHRTRVTAEPLLSPIAEPRLDLAAGHISPDLQSTGICRHYGTRPLPHANPLQSISNPKHQ